MDNKQFQDLLKNIPPVDPQAVQSAVAGLTPPQTSEAAAAPTATSGPAAGGGLQYSGRSELELVEKALSGSGKQRGSLPPVHPFNSRGAAGAAVADMTIPPLKIAMPTSGSVGEIKEGPVGILRGGTGKNSPMVNRGSGSDSPSSKAFSNSPRVAATEMFSPTSGGSQKPPLSVQQQKPQASNSSSKDSMSEERTLGGALSPVPASFSSGQASPMRVNSGTVGPSKPSPVRTSSWLAEEAVAGSTAVPEAVTATTATVDWSFTQPANLPPR